MRVAIIGSGGVRCRRGQDAEAARPRGRRVRAHSRPGGVWAVAYAGVQLQSHRELYGFTRFPVALRHTGSLPHGSKILRLCRCGDCAFRARCAATATSVIDLARTRDRLAARAQYAERSDHRRRRLVIVVLRSTTRTRRPRSTARGPRALQVAAILTEHDVNGSGDASTARRVAVVGLGKTAVDMASFALRPCQADPSRLPRRALADARARCLGRIHLAASPPSACRASSARSWVYPHRLAAD